MTTRVLMILAVAASVACGVKADGPPVIQVDRTACSHCGMLVSEPVYAAAYRAPDSDPRVFDDIRCLLEAAHKEPHADALRFWFHDAATAAWVGGGDVVFVSSPTLRTPMGGGLIAYRDRTAAREAAARHHGSVVDSVGDLLRSSNLGGTRASQAR
jgi:copper chaperone NosL